MTMWVALLRGVNVGGSRKIPMADLRRICVAKTSDPDARSYIASGNLVFSSDSTAVELATALSAGIREAFDFDVPVLVLDGEALRFLRDRCPFPSGAGKAVHAFFCFDDPVLDQAVIDQFKAPGEAIVADGRVVWLQAPDGIGRSKLVDKIDKAITGTELTARNLNTVNRLVEMLDG